MGWLLLVTLMSPNQGSMTTETFTDYKSCMKAGAKVKEAVNKSTPLFNHYIKYKCIQVSGLK